MLSDWRLSRERDAHTRCPDMAPAPRLTSRIAGARFATARRALSGRERWYSRPSRAPILEEPYPACTHAHTTG